MLALGGEHDGLDRVRQCGEERLDAEYGRVVDRVALLRPRQEENGDVAPALGLERARQFNTEAVSGLTHAILAASKSCLGSVTFLAKGVKRSQDLIDREPHRKLFACSGGERQNPVEPGQCRLGGFEPHHRPEIIARWIDRLAPPQRGGNLRPAPGPPRPAPPKSPPPPRALSL